jgi:hypothetical protein
MMLSAQPLIPAILLDLLPPVLGQQLLHGRNLVLHRLRLVGPRPDTDVGLDAHDALFVEQRVRLADERHDLRP